MLNKGYHFITNVQFQDFSGSINQNKNAELFEICGNPAVTYIIHTVDKTPGGSIPGSRTRDRRVPRLFSVGILTQEPRFSAGSPVVTYAVSWVDNSCHYYACPGGSTHFVRPPGDHLIPSHRAHSIPPSFRRPYPVPTVRSTPAASCPCTGRCHCRRRRRNNFFTG